MEVLNLNMDDIEVISLALSRKVSDLEHPPKARKGQATADDEDQEYREYKQHQLELAKSLAKRFSDACDDMRRAVCQGSCRLN